MDGAEASTGQGWRHVLEQADYAYLSVEVRDGIAFATRNRPGNKNRYTSAEAPEYPRFLREATAHPDVRAIVVTGAGTDWFCAGEDLPSRHADADYDAFVGSDRDPNTTPYSASELPDAALVNALLGNAEVLQPLRTPKPIITALNGSVAGGVLTSVLLTDVVVAERHVRLRDMHVAAGLVSATGAMLWPMSTGILRAKRWLLTGDWIDAEEAERIGLVTEVVDSGASLERASAYAAHLAALRPETLWLTKRAINNWLIAHVDDVFTPAFAAEIALLQDPPDR
jgi:enoyl-CoA hydratase